MIRLSHFSRSVPTLRKILAKKAQDKQKELVQLRSKKKSPLPKVKVIRNTLFLAFLASRKKKESAK